MNIKNKTKYDQSVRLSDGTKVRARPYRTISISENIENLDTSVWEVEQAVEKQTTKQTNKKNTKSD